MVLHQIRREFAANDDSEAFLISPAFIPQSSLALLLIYNISSPDTAVEISIISRFTDQVIQRYSLSQRQKFYMANIPSTAEPIYVVLNAYRGVSSATSSASSSVTIIVSLLIPHNES